MFGKKSKRSSDPYREVITEEDIGSVVPAKQSATEPPTQTSKMSREEEAQIHQQKRVIPPQPQVYMPPQEEVLPPAAKPVEQQASQSQFIVDEVNTHGSLEESSVIIDDTVDLQTLKQREEELEAHLASQKVVVPESELIDSAPVENIQEDDPSQVVGIPMMTPDQFVDGLEAGLGELERSLPPAESSEVQQEIAQPAISQPQEKIVPQGDQIGVMYQETTPQRAPEEKIVHSGGVSFDSLYTSAGIAGVRSFDDLYFTLDQLPFFTETSSGQFALTFLKDLIDRVREGNASINTLRSTGQLRNKVLELLNEEVNH